MHCYIEIPGAAWYNNTYIQSDKSGKGRRNGHSLDGSIVIVCVNGVNAVSKHITVIIRFQQLRDDQYDPYGSSRKSDGVKLADSDGKTIGNPKRNHLTYTLNGKATE